MGLLLWLLAATVALSLAAVGAFALAWDVCNNKFKRQLHSITARYEATIRGPAGAGAATASHNGSGSGSGATRGSGGSGSSPKLSSSPGAAATGASSAAPPSVLYESFTLGWLNVLIQHLWLPVLEKLVSNIAAERLQIVLNEVLRKNNGRGVAKYITSVAVEEVTFGLAPPQFQFCTAKYDPVRSYLLLTMNMHFHSSGFQAVLTPRLQLPHMKGFPLRLEVCQLRLAGQLNLGLQLGREPPGVSGVDYWFASPPEFDIQANPVGYLNLHGELPGLLTALRSLLQRVMARRVVEPNRRYLDLQRIYRNKYIQRVGGPGGCLRVCVIGGRNLATPPAAPAPGRTQTARAPGAAAPSALRKNNSSGTASSGGGGGVGSPSPLGSSLSDCDPYVELRFGREIFRTPIVHRTMDPVFNWQFDVRLPYDLQSGSSQHSNGQPGLSPSSSASGGGPVLLHFRVLNVRTLGEPEFLSRGVLDVSEMGLEVNGGPRPRLLELTGESGAPSGTLSLEVAWLKAIAKRTGAVPQDAPPNAERHGVHATAANADAATAGKPPPPTRPPPPPTSYYELRATSAPLTPIALSRGSHGTVQDTAAAVKLTSAVPRRKSEVLFTTPFSVEVALSRLHAVAGSSPMPHTAAATAVAAAAAVSEYGSGTSGSASGGVVGAAADAAASCTLQGWCARGAVDSARVALSPVCSLTSADSHIGCTAAPSPPCHIRHPSTTPPIEGTIGGSTTFFEGSTTPTTNTSASPLAGPVLHELAVSSGGDGGVGDGTTTIRTATISVGTGGRGRGRRSGHGAGKHRRTLAGLLGLGRWRRGGKGKCADGAVNPAAAATQGHEVVSGSSGRTERSSGSAPARAATGGCAVREHCAAAATTAAATAGVGACPPTGEVTSAAAATTNMNSFAAPAAVTSTSPPPPPPSPDASPFNAAASSVAARCDIAADSRTQADHHASETTRVVEDNRAAGAEGAVALHGFGRGSNSGGIEVATATATVITTSATAAVGVGACGYVSEIGVAVVEAPVRGGGMGGVALPASLQSLAQVVKMQRLLQTERQSRAELWGALREVRRKYAAMLRLRRSENIRALMEGARFCLHLGRDVRRVVLWYNESRGLLQVDPDTGGIPIPTTAPPPAQTGASHTGATASSSPPSPSVQHLWPHSFPPAAVQRLERGAHCFPLPSAWTGVVALFKGRSRAPPPTSLLPLKCFSLFLEGGGALHLQLPAAGNGRSRDEWLDGLQDLAHRHGLSSGTGRKRHSTATPSAGSVTARIWETAAATTVPAAGGPPTVPDDCSILSAGT